MTPKLRAVIGLYVADLIKIVLVWFISVMTLSGARFSDLITQAALIALALSLATWMLASVTHFIATGDPTPAPAEPQPQPAPPAPVVPPTPPPEGGHHAGSLLYPAPTAE